MTVIERGSRREPTLHDPLPLAGPLHLERAMVAVGVVAGLAEQDERRPGAARAALLGVVAGLAESPQIARHRAIARVAKRLGALPNVLKRMIADVAAGPRLGGKRRAPFDRAVGLDAQRGAPR